MLNQDDEINNNKDFNDQNNKQRLSSATSSVQMRSTFYTANQTMTKFNNFTSQNTPLQPMDLQVDPRREIKSSYSYFRPTFDFPNLVTEKYLIQAKNRELAEKRHQEEMKEYLNEFGMNRARFKEEVEKKYDTKKIINFYDEILKYEKLYLNL